MTTRHSGFRQMFGALAPAASGATRTEMALVAPVLLFLCYGVLEVGRAIVVHGALNHVAGEVLDRAAADPAAGPEAIREVAGADLMFIDSDSIRHFAIRRVEATGGEPSRIEVQIDYDFRFLLPFGQETFSLSVGS